jgi:hypothetical protein
LLRYSRILSSVVPVKLSSLATAGEVACPTRGEIAQALYEEP